MKRLKFNFLNNAKKIWKFRNQALFKLISLWILFLSFFVVMMMFAIDPQYSRLNIPKWIYILFLLINIILIFYFEFDYFKVYLPFLFTKNNKQKFKKYNFSFKNWCKKVTSKFTMDLLIAFDIHISFFYSFIVLIINVSEKGYDGLSLLFFEIPISLAAFINLGHFLETKLKTKSNIGIKDLLALQNINAWKYSKNNQWIQVSSYELKPNDIILIKKGQSVPVDGVVINGTSYFNYASLTGESLPQKKQNGDLVVSGTINLGQNLKLKVTKNVNNSALSMMINKLEEILESKTSIERFSSKLVKYFIPSILLIGIIAFIGWTIYGFVYGVNNLPYFFFGNIDTKPTIIGVGIWIFISVIIVGCPCAFGIAAPSAIYAASGVAAKNKILFGSAEIYEKLKKVKYVAFDKTGTLTKGKFRVLLYVGDKKAQKIAASLENYSHHPIAKTISSFSQNNLKINNIKEIEGFGIEGYYQNNFYQIASYANFLKLNYKTKINLKINNPLTYVAIAKNKFVIGVYVIGDMIKKDSKHVIKNLHKLKIKTVILSGDNQKVVNYVAKKLDIDLAYGELSPLDKVNKINALKKFGEVVFVGDGLNDLLAMQTASLSMAFSSGSDITNAVADVSLIETDLNLVYKTIHIAKQTLLTVKTNFIWAGLFNFIAIPLAALGIIPPWLGAMLMIVSDILLLSNTIWFKNRIIKFCDQAVKKTKLLNNKNTNLNKNFILNQIKNFKLWNKYKNNKINSIKSS